MTLDMTETQHDLVVSGQQLRPGQSRYRLNCGHYVTCGCNHQLGNAVTCPECLEPRRVTDAALSVVNPETGGWNLVFRHEADTV